MAFPDSPVFSTRYLDDLPSPYLNGVYDLAEAREVYLNVSRGCPFTCGFCSIGITPGGHFSYERVAAELAEILRRAPRLEKVYVVTFDLLDHPRAEDMLALFRRAAEERRVAFRFDINVRNLSRREVVARLNCSRFWIDVGIQSTQPEALKASGRNKEFEKIASGIALAQEAAPCAHLVLGFIRGLPGDTAEGFQHALDWAVSTGYEVKINHLRVLPGTAFGDQPERHGIAVEDEYPYFVASTSTFPAADIAAMTALVDRIGLVWELMKHDDLICRGILELGARARGRLPLPFLACAEAFRAHLEKAPRFRPELELYAHERADQAENGGREFELGELPFEPDRLKFWEALAEFRAAWADGKAEPWPELDAAIASGRARRRWAEAGATRSAPVRRLLEAALRSAEKVLLVGWKDAGDDIGRDCDKLWLDEGLHPAGLKGTYDAVVLSNAAQVLREAADFVKPAGWVLRVEPWGADSLEDPRVRQIGRPTRLSLKNKANRISDVSIRLGRLA